MSFQRRYVGRGESIGGGTKKEKPYCDGLNSYRSHAFAHLAIAGMT